MAKSKKVTASEKDKKIFKRLQASPIYFVKLMWKLIPQPALPEYVEEVKSLAESGELNLIKPHHFVAKDGSQLFVRGEHITWQQWLILLAFERAIAGVASKRISVRSGHGIGKSTVMTWLLIWFLTTHKDARIPCTAPSEGQMFDVLWAECSKWILQMPDIFKEKIDWQTRYIRIVDYTGSENTWYARARTARKESPEALAGLHAKWMLFLIDEAAGIAEEIFNTAEGALTEENSFVFMIGNPTRTIGYFYNSHNNDADAWQIFSFSSIDSPIPSDGYAERIAKNHGVDSDEYKIRVLGEFPDDDAVDEEGYAPIIKKKEIVEIPSIKDGDGRESFTGSVIMGVDPSGEGKDSTDFVVRDRFKAATVLRKNISKPGEIAKQIVTLMHIYEIEDENVYIDMFGVGAKTVVELAKMGLDINGVDVGDRCEDDDDHKLYLNIRALNYYGRLKKWLRSGGELVSDGAWVKELPNIRFRRSTEQNSKIQIMSKRRMRKKKIPSPNTADALMLTFCHDDEYDSIPVKTTNLSERGFRGERVITRNVTPRGNINQHNNVL